MSTVTPTLWRIDEATDKFRLLSGTAAKPAPGDYVINRGEVCRLWQGHNGRMPIVPVAPAVVPAVLAQFAALSG
jgi:hypothetical protein